MKGRVAQNQPDLALVRLHELVDRLGEVTGMGLMGLGGLISVIGGLLFLIVAWKSMRGTFA